MLGLPPSTEKNVQIPKTKVFAMFCFTPAQKESFNADVAFVRLAHIIGGDSFAEGEHIKSISVLQIGLKRRNYNPQNIALLAKLIKQNIIFVLFYEEEVQLAVFCTRLLTAGWHPVGVTSLRLEGLNLDRVWEHCVAQIGGITFRREQNIAEQIVEEAARTKLLRQIEALEKKVRAERQPRHKLELFEELTKLKKQYDGEDTLNK